MSLNPGQIVGQDLSPNANILGTQIADKTLLFRNFSENVFKIVKSGSATIVVPDLTKSTVGVTTGGATTTVAHGLGYAPVILAFINAAGFYSPTGSIISSVGTSAGNYGQGIFTSNVDATNIYLGVETMVWVLTAGATTVTTGTVTVKYYLLKESAAS